MSIYCYKYLNRFVVECPNSSKMTCVRSVCFCLYLGPFFLLSCSLSLSLYQVGTRFDFSISFGTSRAPFGSVTQKREIFQHKLALVRSSSCACVCSLSLLYCTREKSNRKKGEEKDTTFSSHFQHHFSHLSAHTYSNPLFVSCLLSV